MYMHLKLKILLFHFVMVWFQIGGLMSNTKFIVKKAYKDCFESSKCPKCIFLIYLFNHDCTRTVLVILKDFKV